MDTMTATRPWGLSCPNHFHPFPRPGKATPGLRAETGYRARDSVPGTMTSSISCFSRAIKWARPQACVPSPGVAPLPPIPAYRLAPYLSSRLMSTPTEGGAARMSVIRGRNRCRISFREVQPVWT